MFKHIRGFVFSAMVFSLTIVSSLRVLGCNDKTEEYIKNITQVAVSKSESSAIDCHEIRFTMEKAFTGDEFLSSVRLVIKNENNQEIFETQLNGQEVIEDLYLFSFCMNKNSFKKAALNFYIGYRGGYELLDHSGSRISGLACMETFNLSVDQLVAMDNVKKTNKVKND